MLSFINLTELDLCGLVGLSWFNSWYRKFISI